MKFLSIAVAAVLGAMGAAEGKKKISSQEMKSRIQKGQFNSRTLMRSAKPYGKTARKLEEANNGDANEEQQEWQINGLYSVQFSKCLSMTYQDEDLFDENFISYAQDGLLIAEKSFILFTACQSDDCYYQSDEDMTFITDIASFFQAFADFLPNQVENYCEGCNQNYDYCMGTLDAQQEGYGADDAVADDAAADDGQEDAQQEDNNGEEDQQDENQDQEAEGEDQGDQQEDNGEQDNGEQDNAEGQDNGEGEDGDNANEGGRKLSKVMDLPFRKLANNNNQVIQMIDCDMCNAYECFQADEEQANGDDAADDAVVYEFEDALNWLDGLTQCQQMEEATYNDMALYSGLICNSDGTGVEIGIFMDEECTLYAPKLSFGSMMSYSDSMYFSMSEEVVEYMFTNDFSCYQPDVQYTNPYEYEEQEEDANGDDQAEDEPEAAEWCANLFNGSKFTNTNNTLLCHPHFVQDQF